MSEALTKFSSARLKAAHKWPYAAPAILATVPVEKPGVGRIAADKYWRIYFDPSFVTSCDVDTVVSSILFEVSHLIRTHSKRFQRLLGYDPSQVSLSDDAKQQQHTWNDAADLEIVDDFDDERLKLPAGVKRAKELNMPTGLLAEAYYDRLLQQQQGGSGKGKGSSDPQSGSSAADGCPRPWDEPFTENSGKAESKDSGQGNQKSNERDGGQTEGDGDPNDQQEQETDTPGLSEGESDLLTRTVAQRIAEHTKQRGRVPAGLKRWAENITAPKINYRKIIERKVQNAIQVIRGNLDFSYRRPSRRSIDNGIITPSMISRQITCTVVIDASGSMSDRQLGEAVQIVGKLLKALPKRDAIKVVVADTKVHTCDKVFRKEQINLVGGGGTCMDVAIEEAAAQKPIPNLIVTITDGITPWPSHKIPHVDVLAIIVTNGSPTAPRWIEQIVVPPKALASHASN